MSKQVDMIEAKNKSCNQTVLEKQSKTLMRKLTFRLQTIDAAIVSQLFCLSLPSHQLTLATKVSRYCHS